MSPTSKSNPRSTFAAGKGFALLPRTECQVGAARCCDFYFEGWHQLRKESPKMTQTQARDLKLEGYSFGSVKGEKFGFYLGQDKKATKAPTAPLTSWIIFFIHLLGARSPIKVEGNGLMESLALPMNTINPNSKDELRALAQKLEAARKGRPSLAPQQRSLLNHGKDVVLGNLTFRKVDGNRWTLSTDHGGPLKVGPEIILALACIALRDEWVRENLPSYHVPWAPSLRPEYWEGDQPARSLLETRELPDDIWEQPLGDATVAKPPVSPTDNVVTPKEPARQDGAANLLRALLNVEKLSSSDQPVPLALLITPLVAMLQAAAKALTDAGVQPAPDGVSTAELDQQAELLFAKHAGILRILLQEQIAKATEAKELAETHIANLKALASEIEAQSQKVEQERQALKEDQEEWDQLMQSETETLDRREADLKERENGLSEGEAALQKAQAASAKDLLKSLYKNGNG
jgi:DNA repair exonuclease SbcCD ATPase subunit